MQHLDFARCERVWCNVEVPRLRPKAEVYPEQRLQSRKPKGSGRTVLGLTVGIAMLTLSACQPAAQPPTPEQSAKLSPKDARLAQLYAGSCKACHTVADTRAPLTGDRTLWDPRWAKGEDALLTNAQVGFGNMPANGQCFECSPDDLKALITFMAGREE